MTKSEKGLYEHKTRDLIDIFNQVIGMKIRLDCGHHLTIHPGSALANDFTVRQDSRIIVCSSCGYEGM